MAKDYKSYSKPTANKRKGKNKHLTLWIILVVLIVILGYGLYTLKQHQKKLPVVVTKVVDKASEKIAAVVPKIPDQQPIKFEFYSLLTKEKVTVNDNTSKSASAPPTAAVRSAPIATATPTLPAKPASIPAIKPITNAVPAKPAASAIAGSYILQVAALKAEVDANKIKANLIVEGFTAQVRKTTVNSVDWYRVEAGPYTSLADAQDAQTRLQKDGFNGIIKKYS
jgi:cell division protein FtsN